MASDVAVAAGVTLDQLSTYVHPYAYTSIGIYNFLKKHDINSPRLFVPATCHYSWPKAATVLGLGEDNLIHVEVDALARQDMSSKYTAKITSNHNRRQWSPRKRSFFYRIKLKLALLKVFFCCYFFGKKNLVQKRKIKQLDILAIIKSKRC